jgi:hypothetical protein
MISVEGRAPREIGDEVGFGGAQIGADPLKRPLSCSPCKLSSPRSGCERTETRVDSFCTFTHSSSGSEEHGIDACPR